jgi:cell division protease FtsH
VKIAEALLIREILDGNEVMQIIKGGELPPQSTSGIRESADNTQQVIRPEGGRRLGFNEGERPQPA